MRALSKMTPQMWDEVINTNLSGVFYVSKQFVDGMAERGFGRVINISSINAQKGQFGQVNYSAAKAGMHGFTKALAQEVVKKGVYGKHRFPRLYRHRVWSKKLPPKCWIKFALKFRSDALASRKKSPAWYLF